MKNIKLLLFLLEYLKEYLPFEYFKKFSEKDKEVYAFIKLFEKLGGKIEEVDGYFYISKSFEISLRLINGKKVVLKVKKKHKSGHVLMFKRYHISSDELAARCDRGIKNISSMPSSIFDDVGFTINPKTKMKLGNKISKQKQRRR